MTRAERDRAGGGFVTNRRLGLLLLLLLLAIRVWDPGILRQVRLAVFDSYQRTQPRAAPDTPVIVVDIDDASLAAYGQWPWPRTLLAQAVNTLADAGAAAVALDLLFSEPDRLSPSTVLETLPDLAPDLRAQLQRLPDNDVVLADALRRLPVVTARALGSGAVPPSTAGTNVITIGEDPRPHLLTAPGVIESLPVIASAAARQGLISLAPDDDSVVRRVPALARVGDSLLPALSVEALRLISGDVPVAVRASAAGVSSVQVGDWRVPTDRNGRIWLRYAPRGTDRTLSAATLLDGAADLSRVDGAVIFLGSSATALQDIKTTPIDRAMPGVEIHAQILDMVLSGQSLWRPDFAWGLEVALAAAAGLLLIVLVPSLSALPALLLGGGLIGLMIGGSWYLYSVEGLLLDVSYPVTAAALLYGLLAYGNYVREQGGRRRVRAAFSQYLAPELVAELARSSEGLRLGGETREMTVMFCDIHGFTAISERYQDDPQGLTALINGILTPLTDAILARRGTIDKYIGDCVMAFWNAPLDDPEHRAHGCDAAVAMLDAVATHNRDAADKEPLRVGIGINTGRCVVGNMGSAQRFDYSVLGDAVNLAARIEAQSRQYGVDILAGADTALPLADRYAWLEVDLLAVKGKQEASRVFALLGDAQTRQDPDFQSLAADHSDMLAAYRERRWDAAETALASCAACRLAPTGLYALYRTRIAAFRESPPPPDWAGVTVAETK